MPGRRGPSVRAPRQVLAGGSSGVEVRWHRAVRRSEVREVLRRAIPTDPAYDRGTFPRPRRRTPRTRPRGIRWRSSRPRPAAPAPRSRPCAWSSAARPSTPRTARRSRSSTPRRARRSRPRRSAARPTSTGPSRPRRRRSRTPKGWASWAAGKRGRTLAKLAELVKKNTEELAQLESRNTGKPITSARGEIAGVWLVFDYYAGAANKIYGQTIPVSKPGLDMTLREPIGVVGLIVPGTSRCYMASWKVAPALAAGQHRRSSSRRRYSPMTALRLGELALEAGIPPGVAQRRDRPGRDGRRGDRRASRASARSRSRARRRPARRSCGWPRTT